jgi:hypothetical protein
MTNKIEMQLSNPLLIGVYSFALLLIGAPIGVWWGHSPREAVWIVVLGAVLMVAWDRFVTAVPGLDKSQIHFNCSALEWCHSFGLMVDY